MSDASPCLGWTFLQDGTDPTPVGDFVVTSVLRPRGMDAAAFADSAGLQAEEVQSLLHGESRVSPEIADALARFSDLPARSWLSLQTIHDNVRAARNLPRIPDWREIVRLG